MFKQITSEELNEFINKKVLIDFNDNSHLKSIQGSITEYNVSICDIEYNGQLLTEQIPFICKFKDSIGNMIIDIPVRNIIKIQILKP